VARDRPVVVKPQQGDHVTDVVLGLDPARGVARLSREDRVVVDPALLVELVPHGPGKAGVQRVVAVEVAELTATEREGELAAAAGPRLDARPGGDLLGDLLARC